MMMGNKGTRRIVVGHFDCSGHLDDSESIVKERLTVLS